MSTKTKTDKKVEIIITISQKMKEKLYDEATRQGVSLDVMAERMIEVYNLNVGRISYADCLED